MLIIVLSTLIFQHQQRRLNWIFTERAKAILNEWEPRVLVLFSLFFQIVLVVFGKRRKYIPKNWIKIILWATYLSADWIALYSLRVLSQRVGAGKNNESYDPNDVIMGFWAPFLLVHLGGPDTITAYSLEDNELWPRRLLELVLQFAAAFYVLLRSWKGSPVNYLAIPMFIAGIIKFGERIWVLRSASSDEFRDSMLPRPDPGPNYAKFMDGYSAKKAEGFKISVGTKSVTSTVVRRNDFPDALHDASDFFRTFKRLFADLILSIQDREYSQTFFQKKDMTGEKAFDVIAYELGFMYDLLYTKASLIHSRLGSICRFVSLLCTIATFIAFLIFDRNAYSTRDTSITLLLLVGAILLEIYALIVLLSSDWTTLWRTKHKNPLVDFIPKANSFFQSCLGLCFLLPLKKTWSNSVAQYNLMSHCIKRKSMKGRGIKKCINKNLEKYWYKNLEKYWYKNLEPVTKDLKENIFEQLKYARSISDTKVSNIFACAENDNDETKKCFHNLAQSMEVDFDEIILRWHIATDLCSYRDRDNESGTVKSLICMSKLLSNYLVYLLVMCPYMLPSGIGKIRFQDTCAEAIEFIEEREYISDENKACEVLFEVNVEIPPSQIKGDRSKSVLFDGCILAHSLQDLEKIKNPKAEKLEWTTEDKWKMISQLWVEMVSSAASQCRWNYHARRLREGGELLTHVWLLMAHLGITDHFQISSGHLRAKLFLS